MVNHPEVVLPQPSFHLLHQIGAEREEAKRLADQDEIADLEVKFQY